MRKLFLLLFTLALLSIYLPGCSSSNTENPRDLTTNVNKKISDNNLLNYEKEDLYQNNQSNTSQNINVLNENQNLNQNLNQNFISLTELSKHNSKNDCWVGYKGKVYDVTSFLNKHPGGSYAIAKYCGTASEFEKGFEKQHGSSKVNVLEKEGIFKGDLI